MKRGIFPLMQIVFVLFFSNRIAAQDVFIDVTTLTAAEANIGETDFSKTFSVIFTNNTAKANLEIKVKNGETMVTIKKGISEAEKNSFKIKFTSPDGNSLLVTKVSGGMLSLAPVDKISFLYGDKNFTISHKAGGTSNTINNTDNSNSNVNGSGTVTDKNKISIGIELHDALLARQYYEAGDLRMYTLLAKIKNSPKDDAASVVELYKNNKFIAPLLTKAAAKTFTTLPQGGDGVLAGLTKKVMNADVTSFADGFARFLVKRVKEELSIAFFQHFKDLINDEKYKDAQLLFPKTLENLNAIDKDIFEFENYITTLREGFEEDLSTLLDHLPDVIEEGRFQTYFDNHKDVKYGALVSISMGQGLLNGAHPGEALKQLEEEYINGFATKEVTGAIKTLRLLSESIRSRGEERYWAPLDSIKMLITAGDKELIAAKFYLGFLYENATDIDFGGTTLSALLDALAANAANIEAGIKETITYLKALGQFTNNIETALKKIRDKKPEEATIDVYHRLFNSVADFVEQLNKIGTLSYINKPINTTVQKYLAISRQSFDFALNVGHKKYGSAVINAYNIYLKITEKEYKPADEKLAENANLSIDNAPANTSTADNTKLANGVVAKVVAFIKKYGNFMANMVKAKTPEEVEAAIESAALPVGSATIKRHSEWNVALNAYVGPYLGREKIKGIDDGESKPNTAGITAPVGFAISHGINWWKKNGWSTSLFISVIDLGAPVAFRFKDDKTEQIPSIQLKDIVSPGIFASIGFPKFPISCNIGWQSGPLLRKIDPQFASLASSTYSRWSISFVVDIPILNFYTKRN